MNIKGILWRECPRYLVGGAFVSRLVAEGQRMHATMRVIGFSSLGNRAFRVCTFSLQLLAPLRGTPACCIQRRTRNAKAEKGVEWVAFGFMFRISRILVLNSRSLQKESGQVEDLRRRGVELQSRRRSITIVSHTSGSPRKSYVSEHGLGSPVPTSAPGLHWATPILGALVRSSNLRR